MTANKGIPDSGEYVSQMLQVAGNGGVIQVQGSGIVLEPDVPYSFDTPLVLSVRHPSPTGEGMSEFTAIAIPVERTGTYTLTYSLNPTPLLSVKDGAVYAAGTRPAVGGDGVGTHGSGTVIILESRAGQNSGADYVYFLQGIAAHVFNRNTPQTERDTINQKGHFVAYAWGSGANPPPSAIDDDPDRRDIKERLRVLAINAGLAIP